MRISLGNNTELPTQVTTTIKAEDIRNLQVGDIFEGEIRDIRQNTMLLQLKTGQEVMAKLQEQIELIIGQSFMFQVKEKQGEQMIIKPYINETQSPQEQKVIQALEQANLPITAKNIELVQTLLREQMPITKQNLQRFVQLTSAYKEAPLEDLIFLEKHQIPVTQANLEQLVHYKAGEHQLSYGLNKLPQEVLNQVQHMVLTGEVKEALSLHQALISFVEEIAPYVTQEGRTTTKMPQEVQSTTSLQIIGEDKQQVLEKILKDFQVPLPKDIEVKELTPKEILKGIESLFPEKQTDILKELVRRDLYTPMMNEELPNSLGLAPENVEKETVANYYQLIEKFATLSQEAMQKTNTIQEMTQSGNVKNNLDFMKALNQMFEYIQLPIRLKGETIHSDLYVYNKSKKNNSKNASVLLHLDLASLGMLDIYMDKQEMTLFSQFYIEDKASKELLENNIHLLVRQLSKKGYQMIPQIMDGTKKHDFIQDLKKKEEKNSEVKRFSFDIRV